ncbi:mfs transporter [Moniliophthora roreri MCA 2997]|uniref:Lysosomal dipeptide transporter MFSD1 n=2 Tax=Moniliophthora roreri TaxID=221103 RepID=V2YK57_MONRO|nr:mfs transporter [Moniliophthora roreri MCA 2997]
MASHTSRTVSDPDSEKSSPSSVVVPDEQRPTVTVPTSDYPWKYKGPALFCVLFFSLGSNWAVGALSPLKSTLKQELDINNAQYGVIVSANQLVNTVVPVVSGMAIDYYGAEIGSLVSASFVLLGALIAAIGTSTSNFNTLVTGEVILGLGSITVANSQSKLYTHWFYGSYVGLVYGIDLAWTRAISVVSKATAVPIAERTGSYTWSFWVPCILCAASLVINALYYAFVNRLPTELRMPSKRLERIGPTDSRWKTFWFSLMTIPASFWLITVSRICQPSSVIAFTNIAPDVIKVTRGISNATAGYIAALENVIPIILTPALGLFFDRFGRRMWFVSGTAAMYLLVFVLINFTEVHPLVPIMLASVALSANALPFLAAIPLLVRDKALIGTAFGIWKSFINSAGVIMDVSSGAIQDLTPTGRHTYNNVFYMYIALKSVDVIYGLLYDRLDRWQLGGVLRMNEAQRIAKEREDNEDLKKPLQRPLKPFTYLGLLIMACMIICAWAIYLIFSQGS